MAGAVRCRVCGGIVHEFIDFGRQPLSDAFVDPGANATEFFFRLAAGMCESCTMVQLMEEIPRHRMFRPDYPYLSSGSKVMRVHFELTARQFIRTELTGPDPFIVELGCNDGALLRVIAEAGIRHLGVEPAAGVAEIAESKGIQVRKDFFEEKTAAEILAASGQADVIYAANTLCHIPYVDSIFHGVLALLAPGGVFVFEDPYWADIVRFTSFDQIYDEHFFAFTVRSVQLMAARYELELVDAERLPQHGGEVRYTLARAGTRRQNPRVAALLAEERARDISGPATLQRFAARAAQVRDDLIDLLGSLHAQGRRVVGYGATAKSSTVTNYCGIGPDLISFICDSTPAKQGKLTPGSHIQVRAPGAFADPYPECALLFAWNHANEIMAKERQFRAAGGRWILYVPRVHVV